MFNVLFYPLHKGCLLNFFGDDYRSQCNGVQLVQSNSIIKDCYQCPLFHCRTYADGSVMGEVDLHTFRVMLANSSYFKIIFIKAIDK